MVLTFVLFLPIVKVHGNIDNVVFSSEPSDKIGEYNWVLQILYTTSSFSYTIM